MTGRPRPIVQADRAGRKRNAYLSGTIAFSR